MNFNFNKIKHLTHTDDGIFQLFLKYGIKDDTSLQFVKDYLSQTVVCNKNSCGTSVTKIFDSTIVPLVLKKLDEKEHFFTKTDEFINYDVVKDLLIKHKGSEKNIMEAICNVKKNERVVIYINPYGIVRLMEDDFDVYKNENLKALFYKILLLCVYQKDVGFHN